MTLHDDVPTFASARNVITYYDQKDHIISTKTHLTALSLLEHEVPKFSGDVMTCITSINSFDTKEAFCIGLVGFACIIYLSIW